MLRPVVFDCDGVLVDSEGIGWAALEAVLARYGLDAITDDDRAALAGSDYAADHAYFAEKVRLPPPDEMWAELSDVMFEMFDAGLQAFEDAVDTLEVLSRRGVPLAVASNSGRDRLDRSLDATGLAAYFQVSVAREEVAAPKPAPDIYLRAAALLGVDPASCVAVEDTPTGVAAARAAGMTVVAVERGWHGKDELSEADSIVPRLTPISVLSTDTRTG